MSPFSNSRRFYFAAGTGADGDTAAIRGRA